MSLFVRTVNILGQLFIALGWLSVNAAATEGPPGGARNSASLTPVYLASTDIDGGGSYSSRVLTLGIGTMRPVSSQTLAGISFNYSIYDNRFSDANAFGVTKPWGDVERIGLSAPVIVRNDTGWTYMLIPSLDFLRERDADWGDSLTYGAILSGSRVYDPKHRFGIGLGVFQQLEDVKAFPFLAVEWQLTDTLRLNNPLPAGPTGPAGLEINYRLNPKWELGIGTAYRRVRFRLTDDGPYPGGVGEESGIVVFLHAATRVGADVSIDLYGGSLFDGELQVEDSGGHDIARHGFDTAPLFGATVRRQF